MEPMPDGVITVFLADDNLIVRAGVRALLAREPDVEVVGEAADYDELIAGAAEHQPQVVVTDIRMPPTFQREGIDAAKEIRKRHPGTGVVILSQYDDPEYAVSLLAEGAAGYAYLLKDRLAEGDQLVEAIRAVATGGTLARPGDRRRAGAPRAGRDDDLSDADEELLTFIAEGKPIKAIAVAAPDDARGRRRRRRAALPRRWPRARRPAPTARCAACACCTRRSSTARSRARRCPGCSPAAWPRSSARRASTSARPRSSRSPC